MNIEQKKEEYKDDEELLKFLSSDKSDEYKNLIISLLETDYSKCTWGSSYMKNCETYKARKNDDYRERNKDLFKQRHADYREASRQEKRYYCELCDKAFGTDGHLQQHFKTKKHQKKSRA